MPNPQPSLTALLVLASVALLDGAGLAQTVVGVLDEPEFPTEWSVTPADRVIESLDNAGVAWVRLTAADLADPSVLDPARIATVLLPSGPYFPVDAVEPFRAYLRSGGRFLSLGGYAFSRLVERTDRGWASYADRIAAARSPESLAAANVLPPVAAIPWTWGATLATPDAAAGVAVIEAPPPGAAVAYAVDLEPGEPYMLKAELEAQGIAGRGYAFVAYYEMDDAGQIVQWFDMDTIQRNGERRTVAKTFVPDPRATRREVRAGAHLTGGQVTLYDLVLAPYPEEIHVTTANGIPADGLRTRPEQFGLFDPSHPLEHVAAVSSAGHPRLDWDDPVPLAQPAPGWSASGLTFDAQARWVPLAWAHDRYGRLNGTAAAALLHYGGPYAGSAWAYCGIEEDIYRVLGVQRAEELVLSMVRLLDDGLSLDPFRCEEDTYTPDEAPRLSITVRNTGLEERRVRVDLRHGATVRNWEGPIAARGSHTASFELPAGGRGLQRIEAELRDADQDGVLDRAESAYVVRSPEDWPETPTLAFEDNVFTLGGVPRILLGSDAYVVAFTSPSEGPLAWARDLDRCRDYGLDVYENLHFPWYPGGFTDHEMRQIEGFAYLAAERGRQYMAGWLIGADTWVSDEVLDDQAAFLRRAAARTAGAGHLIHYINGDLRGSSEPEQDGTGERFRAWLLQRHGGPDGLRAAWGDEMEWPIDHIPFLPSESPRWDSVRAMDYARFAVAETLRWNERLAAALRETGGGQPITNEYYQMPMDGVDLQQTIGPIDVANIGFFGHEKGRDLADFTTAVAFADSRARGKGVNVGEFGVKTHPAWSVENGAAGYHIARTKEEERELFLGIIHLGLGLGVTKYQNWCLRDSSEYVFPWGLFHPSDVTPKESAYTYRHLSLLAHSVTPVYEAPEVTLLLPDWHRLGNGGSAALEATYRAIETLQSLHVPFNVLPDTHADEIPATTRVLWWPVPFTCSDGTRDAVEEFVGAGGSLYLSGDLSYDELRLPSRADRFSVLVGLSADAAPTPSEWTSGESALRPLGVISANVLMADGAGEPLITLSEFGGGRVAFLNSMAELALPPEQLAPLYRTITAALEVQATAISPADTPVLAFRVPLAEGGEALILHNPTAERARVSAPLSGGTLDAELMPGSPALVAVDEGGQWRAVSVRGHVTWNGVTLTAEESGACAVSLGGHEAVAVGPYGPGTVTLQASGIGSRHGMGELVDGAWRVYAERDRDPEASLRLSLDDVDWTLIHLFAAPDACEAAGAEVARIIGGPGAAGP